MRRALLILFVMGTLLSCSGFASLLRAEDFRIDTDYYVGSAKTPTLEVLTIFHGGIAYDFQEPEITILDPRRGRFTLLDTKNQVRATVETAELLEAAIGLQSAALQSKNPALVAAARPEFQKSSEEFNENGNVFTRLTFRSAPLQYTVVGQAARVPEAAQEFKYFADWSARLNSIRNGLPAGARLELNEELAAKGLIPTRIERSIPGAKKSEVRTQHSVIWKLSQDDHRRIDTANNHLVNFRLVTFDEYVKLKR